MKWLMISLVIACNAQPRAPRRQVVFVCEHGAAKSVIAMDYFNKLAAERGLDVRAVARGADPQDKPSSSALAGLRGDGLQPSGERPRPLAVSEARDSARVIAFDCDQPAVAALQRKDACWDDVPTVSDDYARARDAIRAHIAALLEQ